MSIETIVIVGAGQAGASAILELRQHQYAGKIILIGEEAHLPYERPPLSKDAILNPEETKLEILSQQKLQDLNVEVILNQPVQKIHRYEHVVELANGKKIHYDKLLIATGAAPRRLAMLDALGKHVYTLRNLEDAQALISVLQPKQRLVLVGGGVIGLELASSARARQAEVTVLEMSSTVMARTAPRLLSDFLLVQHRKAGVDIRLETEIMQAKIENDHIVIDLNNTEQLHADAIIYGIGVIPNAQIAVDAGLDVDFAILVNQNCQTSDLDIYAAGDVATQLRENGQYCRIETWENANLQAGIFARHVMRVEQPKANPAWFWTDQLGFNIQFSGDMTVTDWRMINVEDAKTKGPAFVIYGLKDDVIVGGITVNAARKMRAIKKMITSQTRFESLAEIA